MDTASYSSPLNHRPSISASSSTSSSSSVSSVTSFSDTYLAMPSHNHLSGAAAPLPSPAANETNAYFTAYPSQSQHPLIAQQQQQAQHQQQLLQAQAHQQHRQAAQYQQQQQQQPQQHGHHPHRQSSSSSTDSEASLHLRDFSLIAEAAKRAQMACVTRDFEEFGL